MEAIQVQPNQQLADQRRQFVKVGMCVVCNVSTDKARTRTHTHSLWLFFIFSATVNIYSEMSMQLREKKKHGPISTNYPPLNIYQKQ